MSPIRNLTLTCDRDGPFSEGDAITGTVSFHLTKETKVKSASVKAKGDAHVHWTEGSGDDETSYTAHRRYFKDKQFFVAENANDRVLPKGSHHFKFSLKIPSESMPSSFKGAHGHIVYMLEAKISRKWRWSSTVKKELNFLSKSVHTISRRVCPQSGSVNKKLGVFSNKEVQMSASVNRDVCSPGDTLSAFAKVCNSSSKSMRFKFSVLQKTVFRASGSTNTSSNVLFKAVGNTVGPKSEATCSCNIKIPTSAIYNMDNCEIISVEHVLKVYLDISFRVDPEVVFPLVIAPSSSTSPDEEVEPSPFGAFGAPSYSDFPAGSGVSQYPAPVPTQPANPASGYEWPQNAPSYGFSAAALAYQPEVQPPSYTSLFDDCQGAVERSDLDQKRT
ncbi:arrestin domain-containing protein 3-like [Kryptolebias marmoratus]|uniref:arrestin domain-containing protein 3-like n=1 Tax=Kryptolebias marmoratus TaxID=37003 RepID=UPI0018ACA1B5|nr:arrestin domain-containing protein 3-like [Kryptolebias marmoratus]